MAKIRQALGLLSLAGVSACGNWDAVYRTHDFRSEGSAIVDIKTRSILASPITVELADGTKKTYSRVCAEPSPDALTSYAAQLSVQKEVFEGASTGLAGGYQGAAAFVGMRTQTVQLLRDQMYRLCEANVNGFITDTQYEMLMTRNQRYTLALMAIENLAQATQAPAVAISSESNLKDENERAQTKLTKAKSDKTKLEAITEADRTDAQKQELKNLESTIERLEKQITQNNKISSTSVNSNPNDDRTSAIVGVEAIEAISKIAGTLLTVGEDGYKCFNYISDLTARNLAAPTSGAQKIMYDFCEATLLRAAKPDGESLLKRKDNPQTQRTSDTFDRGDAINSGSWNQNGKYRQLEKQKP
ncbi:hypothetical protein [Pseudomonas sp. DWP3-1-2]|uniref:hypothetical protein n=1 Tax=Pseudomonas sp. DWP3-1-2 TaxID=2804645 RepID=UPI003CECCA47